MQKNLLHILDTSNKLRLLKGFDFSFEIFHYMFIVVIPKRRWNSAFSSIHKNANVFFLLLPVLKWVCLLHASSICRQVYSPENE